MDLFPIGEIADSSNQGTMDGFSYSMFEPNVSVISQPVYNNLVTLFQTQTRLTRKKAEPFLSITYNYNNIFSREYNQIEHFVDYVEDALTSFYTVDWSRHETIGVDTPKLAVTGDTSNWIVDITNTRVYSTTTNKKANYAIVWNGSGWKLGQVLEIDAGVALRLDVLYGNLSLADAQFHSLIYPVYCVYFAPAALSSFEPTEYIRVVDSDEDGGWMRSGSLTFISKYPAI